MTIKVHVNQHVIRANIHKAEGEREPPLRIIRGRSKPEAAFEVLLMGPARVVYSPDKPLKCGARLWIEADGAEAVPQGADQ